MLKEADAQGLGAAVGRRQDQGTLAEPSQGTLAQPAGDLSQLAAPLATPLTGGALRVLLTGAMEMNLTPEACFYRYPKRNDSYANWTLMTYGYWM